MKKHTNGEWKLNPLPNPTTPDYYCLYVKDGDHTTVEHIVTITSNGLNNKNEIHANAKLISAAPDLLNALYLAEERIQSEEGTEPSELIILIHKAIAKATAL
jgi:hypothetical protein